MERTLRSDCTTEENRDDLLSTLYYLMVYGYSYLQNDIVSLGGYSFIWKYNTYINEVLSVHFPLDACKLIFNFLMPNICLLDEKEKVEIQSYLCKHYKEEELPEKWIMEILIICHLRMKCTDLGTKSVLKTYINSL